MTGAATLCALALFTGCRWRAGSTALRPAATASVMPVSLRATGPASGPSSVAWQDKGLKLRYPADWRPRKDPDYELVLVPSGGGRDARRITVDIPDLPPHLPFMVQMQRVQHDYLQDLKRKHRDLQVIDEADVKVPQSVARLVRSSWHEGKETYDDVVLLIIHASAVYILDAQTDEPHLPQTRTAFDGIRSSLRWAQ